MLDLSDLTSKVCTIAMCETLYWLTKVTVEAYSRWFVRYCRQTGSYKKLFYGRQFFNVAQKYYLKISAYFARPVVTHIRARAHTHTHTHTQHGDLKSLCFSLFSTLAIKGRFSRLSRCVCVCVFHFDFWVHFLRNLQWTLCPWRAPQPLNF
jgi:hypothetical protein